MIDCNVTLFQWPFRRLPGDQTAALAAKLKRHGFEKAWASSFEGILNRDLAGVNLRLADECRRNGSGFFQPFGVVNPVFPDWREDLRRCSQSLGMPGIRVFPSYHGYGVDHPQFGELLEAAADRKLILQLPVLLEDSRTQHPLVQVPEVELLTLEKWLPLKSGLKLLLLNYRPRQSGIEFLREAMTFNEIYLEVSNVESAGGIGRLMESLPEERLLFGSHAPFFIFESALLKIEEAALPLTRRRLLLEENPERVLQN